LFGEVLLAVVTPQHVLTVVSVLLVSLALFCPGFEGGTDLAAGLLLLDGRNGDVGLFDYVFFLWSGGLHFLEGFGLGAVLVQSQQFTALGSHVLEGVCDVAGEGVVMEVVVDLINFAL
jgi:hypothetical protein